MRPAGFDSPITCFFSRITMCKHLSYAVVVTSGPVDITSFLSVAQPQLRETLQLAQSIPNPLREYIIYLDWGLDFFT